MEIVVSPKSCCENSKELMQWAESLASKKSLKKKKKYIPFGPASVLLV